MVGMGCSLLGLTPPASIPPATKIDGPCYRALLTDSHFPHMAALAAKGGQTGKWISQQDNAPARTGGEVKAWLLSHMHKMLDPWPACSPDLAVLDYSVWSILAQWVDDDVREQNISTEVGLKLAVRAAVRKLSADMPLVERCVMDFPRRVRACIDAEGGHFEHKEQKKRAS